MSYLIKAEGYSPLLGLRETERVFKEMKEFFLLNRYLNRVYAA